MGERIRVAYLIDTISSDKAGTEKQLLNIIGRLDPTKFEVTLVCLYASQWMLRNVMPCEVVSLGYRGFLKPDFPLVMRHYLSIIKDKTFDVVQTFFEDSMIVGFLGKCLSRRRHAVIVSRRDLGLGVDEPAYHQIYKIIQPALLRRVDGIAVNAHAIKAHLAKCKKVPPERISVIGNGLDVARPSQQIPALFREWQADFWVGLVANLKPVKRIDLFLHAFARLKEMHPHIVIRGVILGEGRLRKELVSLADSLGIGCRVHFIGGVDNVEDYLQHFDIGVLCSDKEGLSNAVMEYMSCGLPVIVTAVGGNCELVDDSNGICIPAGDVTALSNAIGRLVSSSALRVKLGRKSLQKIRTDFAWEMIMPQWENFYHAITVRCKS